MDRRRSHRRHQDGAYDGHPLYTFVEDKAPGDIKGDGKGGVWHVAKGE